MLEKDKVISLYEAYPILVDIDNRYEGIIFRNAMFKELIAGKYLPTHEGGCSGFLFVLSGTIKIHRLNEEGEETNLYNIEKGQVCHEVLSCFVENKPLNIVGKAIQDSKICIVPFEIVSKYLLIDREFLKYIYKDLHDKFNQIIGSKEEIKHEPLKKRLVKFLMKGSGNVVYTTHGELAFELDSAREVVSRKLKELEKEGYIKLERGKITVLKDLSDIVT